MSAVLPLHTIDVHEPDVRLVNEARYRQRMTWALAIHVMPGEPMQFAIDQGGWFFEGRSISVPHACSNSVICGVVMK